MMMMMSLPSVQPIQYMQSFLLILFFVMSMRIRLSDDALESLLVPLDLHTRISIHCDKKLTRMLKPYRLLLGDLVASTNSGLRASTPGNTLAWAGHAAVEVHAVDTDAWIVLDAQIDVLRNTEAEVASLGEVALAQLVLLDLEATLENLDGLLAADGNVDSDLLVSADTEGTDGVAGLGCWQCVSAISFA